MVWMPDNQIAVLIQEWERARAGAEEFMNSMPDDKPGSGDAIHRR